MLKSLLKEFDRVATEIVILIFLLVLVVLYFAPNIFYNIPSGHVGVLWRRFDGGTVTNEYLPEGMHAIWPWDKIFVYDARLQKQSQIFHVLASDGLRLKIDVVYRYRINKKDVGLLQKYAGQHWADIMLAPSVAAKTRDIVSQDSPEEIYSSRRLEIQREIKKDVAQDLYNHFNPEPAPGAHPTKALWVVLEDVLIRSVTPPPQIEQAIMRKYEARQNEEEYDFRLMAAAKEAERKKIEAEGIKEFQDIVSPGITNSYLRLRGIEATQALASSNNAKIVIFGNDKSGLPLILGNVGSGKSQVAKPASKNHKHAARASQSKAFADAGDAKTRAAAAKDPPVAVRSSFDRHSSHFAALREVLRKIGIPVSAAPANAESTGAKRDAAHAGAGHGRTSGTTSAQ